jgi:uncharacterized membrane protein YkvA (DUF1232 family)
VSGLRKTGWRIARACFRAWGKGLFQRGGLFSAMRAQWKSFTALLRMMQAWVGGRYREVPARTLLFSVLALLYFVSPIDLITDFVPVIGWLDDAAVIVLLLSAIGKDLDRFRAWEGRGRRTIEADHPASVIS